MYEDILLNDKAETNLNSKVETSNIDDLFDKK